MTEQNIQSTTDKLNSWSEWYEKHNDRSNCYIKSEEHFINFIMMIIKNHHDEIKKKMFDIQFYVDQIYYDKYLTDKYTWALKCNPRLLESRKVFNWIAKNAEINKDLNN